MTQDNDDTALYARLGCRISSTDRNERALYIRDPNNVRVRVTPALTDAIRNAISQPGRQAIANHLQAVAGAGQ